MAVAVGMVITLVNNGLILIEAAEAVRFLVILVVGRIQIVTQLFLLSMAIHLDATDNAEG